MGRIIMQPSGKAVEYSGRDTVLIALEKAGYALPSNCRAGACGECKVKVSAGQFDQGTVLEMALSQEERRQGYGLMCMATPVSDELVIEWGTGDARPKLFPPEENLEFVVIDKYRVTDRIVELRFRPVGQPVRYWPGQYVTLGKSDENVPARPYSIANAPRPDGEIVLHVARVDGGIASTWIHDRLAIGESVMMSGPYGTFVGDPSVDAPVLCLAAGTGLAPILALTEAALRRGFPHPVTLMFSARSARDIFGLGLMAWWRTRQRRFSYRITLTREHQRGFLRGRIDAVLPALFPDLSNHTVFVAGAPAFVDTCVATVDALGARSGLIHTERYVARQAPVTPDADQLITF